MIIIETFERWRQPRAPPRASRTNRECRRDPARLALTSRRNTPVAANAVQHALRQDQTEGLNIASRQAPDPPSTGRKVSLAASSSA